MLSMLLLLVRLSKYFSIMPGSDGLVVAVVAVVVVVVLVVVVVMAGILFVVLILN